MLLANWFDGSSGPGRARRRRVLRGGVLESLERRALLSTAVANTPTAHVTRHATAATVTVAPVAISPGTTTAPGPVLTTATPTLSWKPVSGATGYQISVYDETVRTLSTFTVSGGSVTSDKLGAGVLASGDSFVWNVRALSGSTMGPVSGYLDFQTPAAVTTLPAPVLVSPGATASPGPVLMTFTPTLSWKPVSGATGYQVGVYDKTQKTSYTFTVSGGSTTSSTLAAGVLAPSDLFTWDVRALSGTARGPKSANLDFQTPAADTALTAPAIISPGTPTYPGPVLTTTTPTLSWEPVSGATGYQVSIYDETLRTLSTFTVSGGSTTSDTVPPGLLAAGASFVWNVRGLEGTAMGPVSAYLHFQTPAVVTTLKPPVVISPGTATAPGPVLTTSTPTFSWKPVSGATGYQISVYNETRKTLSTFTVSGGSTTSDTLAAGALASGDSFVWNVRALRGSTTGPVSAYFYFQTHA